MSERLVEFMGAVTGWLNVAEIPYMVAGSFASTYHGHPRATQHADIVIDPSQQALEMLIASVSSERAYIDRRTALSALAHRDMFNLIDLVTGWKADFIVRKERPFSIAEVLNSRGHGLDVGYIESWVDALGVGPLWREALSRREVAGG